MQKYNEYVFIDESGCSGFKLDSGSSHFFVVLMIIFKSKIEIEKCSVALKQLRLEVFKNEEREFKYANTKSDTKLKFFEIIEQFDFTYHAVVVDKKVLYSPELKTNKDSYYNYFIKLLLKNNSKFLTSALIKIDGSGDRDFKRQFKSYIKKEVNQEYAFIKNIKMEDSKDNMMIQMADMLAGAVRKSKQEGHGVSAECLYLIKGKISNIWNFK